VTARHAVLSVGAALVLGLGVYLFAAVRAEPALPVASPGATSSARSAAREVQPTEAPHDAPSVQAPTRRAPVPPAAPRPAPAVPPTVAPAAVAPDAAPSPEPPPIGPKLETAMAEANKAYDRGDLEDAKAIAGRLLQSYPNNVRMLRMMVSASCIDGDSAVAELHFAHLPPTDQAQMRVRCSRYGIAFPDKPQ
jgi:hypothetical protein